MKTHNSSGSKRRWKAISLTRGREGKRRVHTIGQEAEFVIISNLTSGEMEREIPESRARERGCTHRTYKEVTEETLRGISYTGAGTGILSRGLIFFSILPLSCFLYYKKMIRRKKRRNVTFFDPRKGEEHDATIHKKAKHIIGGNLMFGRERDVLSKEKKKKKNDDANTINKEVKFIIEK